MPRFRLKDDSMYCFQWDGAAETADGLIGHRYGVDWEYISEDSLAIRIFLDGNGLCLDCNVGDWVVKCRAFANYTCDCRPFHVYAPDQFAIDFEPDDRPLRRSTM